MSWNIRKRQKVRSFVLQNSLYSYYELQQHFELDSWFWPSILNWTVDIALSIANFNSHFDANRMCVLAYHIDIYRVDQGESRDKRT